jgi:hypothetical protein
MLYYDVFLHAQKYVGLLAILAHPCPIVGKEHLGMSLMTVSV